MYLKNLNGLRFFAAVLVLIYHAKDGLLDAGIGTWATMPFLNKGHAAVYFFFCLSGFLLTYLAIQEHRKNGFINFRAFYIRRIFRILPLYFFCVLAGILLWYFIIPYFLPWRPTLAIPLSDMIWFFLMLPNWALGNVGGETGSFIVLWSIGVEEQFYLLFPLLMVWVLSSKHLKVSVLKLVVLILVYFVLFYAVYPSMPATQLQGFLKSLYFHFMLVGILGAVLVQSATFKALLNHKMVQWGSVLLLLCIVFLSELDHLAIYGFIQSTAFIGIILTQSCAVNPVLNLEHRFLKYGGMISYGIYMLHPFVAYPFKFLLLQSVAFNSIMASFPPLYYCLIFTFSYGIAHLSYRYFESYFMRKKEAWATLQS
jgi:peptidoglycan/LPS O-acetylase OafA/YrhL